MTSKYSFECLIHLNHAMDNSTINRMALDKWGFFCPPAKNHIAVSNETTRPSLRKSSLLRSCLINGERSKLQSPPTLQTHNTCKFG